MTIEPWMLSVFGLAALLWLIRVTYENYRDENPFVQKAETFLLNVILCVLIGCLTIVILFAAALIYMGIIL